MILGADAYSSSCIEGESSMRLIFEENIFQTSCIELCNFIFRIVSLLKRNIYFFISLNVQSKYM